MSAKKSTLSRVKAAPSAAAPVTAKTQPVVKRRVMLVEDHPMTREGLAAVINRQTDMQSCCEASSPAEALSLLSKAAPDLVVTDLTMPGRSGIEFLKDVHALRPELPLLVLSMHDEVFYAQRALRAGARGYLMKDVGAAKVLEVIRLLLSGQSYVSPKISARMLDEMTGARPRGSSSPIEKLSDREFEIFQLFGSGKSTKEIAEVLHLSPKTVAVHRSNTNQKLQLSGNGQLIHYAMNWVKDQER